MRAFAQDSAARMAAKLRPIRNRAFRTALRAEAEAPVVVLSPHPDDAVLDCWSVLTGPGHVHVVNEFAGVPPAGAAGYFERLSGAADAAEHMRRRLEEDRHALSRAGRSAINLGFRSLTHRPGPARAVVRSGRRRAARACREGVLRLCAGGTIAVLGKAA